MDIKQSLKSALELMHSKITSQENVATDSDFITSGTLKSAFCNIGKPIRCKQLFYLYNIQSACCMLFSTLIPNLETTVFISIFVFNFS